VCGVCGGNLTGNGVRDYICQGFTDGGRCTNDLRFRRAAIDAAVVAAAHEYLTDDEQIRRGIERVRAELERRARTEDVAARRADAAEVRRLDDKINAVRALDLPAAATTAAVAALDAERRALIEAAAQHKGQESMCAPPRC